jgi:hypothetical protein
LVTPPPIVGLLERDHFIDARPKSLHREWLDHHLFAGFELTAGECSLLGVARYKQHFQPGQDLTGRFDDLPPFRPFGSATSLISKLIRAPDRTIASPDGPSLASMTS